MSESLSVYVLKKLHACISAVVDAQTGAGLHAAPSEGDFTVLYLQELQKAKSSVLSYGQNKHLNIT